MRFASAAILLMFMFFISTPTIVSLIKKSSDTSILYSMSEEELSHKEIKVEFRFEADYSLIGVSGNSTKPILSENLSKHDNVAMAIFIPPPEQS